MFFLRDRHTAAGTIEHHESRACRSLVDGPEIPRTHTHIAFRSSAVLTRPIFFLLAPYSAHIVAERFLLNGVAPSQFPRQYPGNDWSGGQGNIPVEQLQSHAARENIFD